jgi:hypothetical protein
VQLRNFDIDVIKEIQTKTFTYGITFDQGRKDSLMETKISNTVANGSKYKLLSTRQR